MFTKEFRLVIATPDDIFFEDNAQLIILKTSEGEICILKNHEPFVASLRNDLIEIQIDGKRKKAVIAGGFIEVKPDKVRIITDSAEWPENINLERAENSLKRAEERLSSNESINIVRAEASKKRALARIKAYENKVE